MRRIPIMLAVCALMAGDLSAKDHLSGLVQEEERATKPLSEWLPSVLPFGSRNEAEPSSLEPEPAAAEPAAPSRTQQRRRTATQPKPEQEPEPQLTPEEEAAEAKWWQEVGDPAVAAFSHCLAEHVAEETARGNESSYPDFVTAAMNSRCSREFAAMAQPILDRHGEDNFAKIARKLIATKFVPVVKQTVEEGLPEAVEPQDDMTALEVQMRQSKEAMFGCFVAEADRLAASSPAAVERLADQVISSCKSSAETYFGKVEQLYPGTTGGPASDKSAAILDASYRPSIVQRIETLRDEGGRAEGGRADMVRDQP